MFDKDSLKDSLYFMRIVKCESNREVLFRARGDISPESKQFLIFFEFLLVPR